MATVQDAELILKLYELRTEETMRKARAFVAFQMKGDSLDYLLAIRDALGTQENAYWRQVISYWEMAASFVLRQALDADLFLDSAAEGIYLYAKFAGVYADAPAGTPAFMPHTAKLIEQYPVAKARHQAMLTRLASLARSAAEA